MNGEAETNIHCGDDSSVCNQTAGNSCPLPLYQSHKQVRAFKIERIEFDHERAARENSETDGSAKLYSGGPLYLYVKVDHRYVSKHDPQAGGYYVRYEDGYESWSPSQAFEEGYKLV